MQERTAIRAEVARRLAAVLPGATDVTGEPFATAPERVPAFAFRLEAGEVERVAMGSPAWWVSETLVLAVWRVLPDGAEPDLLAAGDALVAGVMAEPRDLGGLVEDIAPDGMEVETVRGRTRVARLDLRFAIRFRATAPESPVSGWPV